MKRLSHLINHHMPGLESDAAAPDLEEDAPVHACDHCGDLGYVKYSVPVGHPMFGKAVPCPNPSCPTVTEQMRARYTRLVDQARLPDASHGSTFQSWFSVAHNEETMTGKMDALGAMLVFVQAVMQGRPFTLDEAAQRVGLTPLGNTTPRRSVVLSGTQGLGKTSLVVSAARSLLEGHIPTLYIRMADLLDAIQERFSKEKRAEGNARAAGDEYEYDYGSTHVSVLATFQHAPVLVLDELSQAQPSVWAKSRIEALVRFRMNADLPTLYTTNLNPDDFTRVYGAVISHAVQSMSHWLEMGGPELRDRSSRAASR